MADTSQQQQPPRKEGSGIQVAGWMVFVLGLVGCAVAFTMPITVESYTYGTSDSGVVNISLIHQREITLHCSLAAVLVGTVMGCCGAIISTIRER